ncbi:hypothetical protein JTB14_014149 [Gonioctena quinquepunctata]|nr:hypothetical protein JTB14_014149 [Gonioctena quinquepunctata]
MDAMQFAVPFIEVADTISGNLSQIPEQRPPPSTTLVVETEVSQEESVFSEDILSASHSLLPPSPQSTPLPQPTPSPLPASPLENEAPPVSTGSGQQGPRGLLRRKTQTKQSDAEKAFAKYFAAKTQKISNSSSTDVKRKGIQKFLNSLIPDLMQLNDVQLRIYKRKALHLIDEITGTSQEIVIANPNQFPPSLHIVQPQTASSSVSSHFGSSQSTDPSEEGPIIYQNL